MQELKKIPYNQLPSYAHERIRDFGDFDSELDRAFERSWWESKTEWLDYLRYNDHEQIEGKIWDDLTVERQHEIAENIKKELRQQAQQMENLCVNNI